jgi:hypothetical protein
MTTTTETDFAWAAGFIDGEGCLFAYRRANGYQAGLTVTGTDVTVLERLAGIIGGRVTPKTRTNARWAQAYQVQIHAAAHLAELLPRLMPYLTAKYDEAELLLEFSRSVGGHGVRVVDARRRDEIVAAMSDLKGTSGNRGRRAASVD